MFGIKSLIFYLIIYEGVGHKFDPIKGIITAKDNDVFVYDQMIYIPVVLSIPSKIKTPLNTWNDVEGCNTLELLQRRMDEVILSLKSKIPDIEPITSRPNLTSFILQNGKLNVSKISAPNHELKPPQDDKDHIKIMPNPRTTNRHKRFAFVGWGIIGLLGLAGGLITWNSIEISSLRSNMAILSDNQKLLYDKTETLVGSVNILTKNQERISFMVNNLTEKLNEVIEDQNCLRINYENQINLINNWSNVVPNSFIRAINGAINRQLTIDLIPGEKLQDIVRFYSEFSNTIFETNPVLLYESAKVLIVKLSKEPLLLETLVIVPRIMTTPFGVKYIQQSCHWSLYNKSITLSTPKTGILSQEKTWWETNKCIDYLSVTLCDIKDLYPSNDPCLLGVTTKNITGCPIKYENAPPHETIQLKDSVVVCMRGEHITIFKRDKFGIVHPTVINNNNPYLITSKEADSVLIGAKHFNLDLHTPIVEVEETYLIHKLLNDNVSIDKIQMDTNIAHIDQINSITGFTDIQSYHNISIYICILILVILILVIIVIYYRRKHRNNKKFGFLMSRIMDKDIEKNGKDSPMLMSVP